jgi:hypothetical protein
MTWLIIVIIGIAVSVLAVAWILLGMRVNKLEDRIFQLETWEQNRTPITRKRTGENG